MFEPRGIEPDASAARGPLDRLSSGVGDETTVFFECTRAGVLLDSNTAYRDLERCAGLADGALARLLVERLAPGGESIAAIVELDVLGASHTFLARFVTVSTRGENDAKYVGVIRESAVSADRPARDTAAGWPGDDLVRVNSDWYWETDDAGALTSVSRSLELLLGRPVGGLLGSSLASFGTLLPGENGEVPVELARARGSSFRDQLMSIDTATGGTRLYRLAGVAVPGRGGSSGYRGVAVVLPNSARLIERMRSELGRNAKQQFLAAMSHELRTPLNAIIGFAEAMSQELHGPLKPQYVDYAGDIASAGRHLLGLIQDLLDISSLDAGEVELDCDGFDLAALVDEARAMVSVNADARSIDIRGVDLAYPVSVRADRRRTLQILVNLLGNAIKFTPEGGMVGCALAAAETPHETALTVWDTGPGIDPKDHERVFEKFEQLSNRPHVASGDGTGLGLHISRRLAGLMGGSLTLASKPGEGARFTLTLPAGD